MKFSALQENLKQGLFAVGHIAGKNQNLPILNNILIDAKDGNIKLSSTNLELGINCTVRGKVDQEGLFTVDAKILLDYINLLPNKKIDMDLQGDKMVIVCDKYNTKINGQSAEDYPLIPMIDRLNSIEVDLMQLRNAITQVNFAVANNDMRAELSGVLMVIEGDLMTLVATDSYRLAEKRVRLKNKQGDDLRVIVPSRTMQEVLRIISGLKSQEKVVSISFTENQILFSCESIDIISRIIEGQYPDYTQIIPTQFKTNVKIATSELGKAVKAASLFSKSGVNDVNLDFPKDKNLTVVSSASGLTGENITDVESIVSGEDNGVVVNYRYLIDGLTNINTETVDLGIVDSNTPCVFKPDGEDGYLYIIMPIKQ
jgi:DNA polymerase III subunit beta